MSESDPAPAGGPTGRKRGAAKKLSDEKVRDIRRLARQPCPMCDAMPTLRSLAAKFDVSAPTILEIIERRSWAHVGEEPPAPPSSEEESLKEAATLLGRHNIEWSSDGMLRFAAQIIQAARRDAGASGGRRASDRGEADPARISGDRRRRSDDPA